VLGICQPLLGIRQLPPEELRIDEALDQALD